MRRRSRGASCRTLPKHVGRFLSVLLLVHCHALAADPELAPNDSASARRDSISIQGIVDDLRSRLALVQAVHVSVVPSNPLKVSVESVDDLGERFLLSFDESFLTGLTDEELQAAVAHELGHVWIFTHHPYLQTEALANQIAERVVTRESLVRVYEKVWKVLGTKGDLARFVGD
jgi:hypothetical protein